MTRLKRLAVVASLLFLQTAFAQFPQGKGGGGKMPSIAHLYGKILDAKTKEPVEFASVALLWFDKDSAVAGCLVKANGDFSLDNLAFGAYRLRISFVGYKTLDQKMFINMQNVDKDLGDILLQPDEAVLKEVVVTEDKSAMQMSIDRKIYNVDKDIATRGGTGLDAVKNIPSVTIDASGNVSLRNNSVAIYVDGRPTTLSLQQIPADQIDRVEIITNPSVKFDASTTGGILNVIMKHNTKPGYNGMVQAGIGTNDRYNGMANLNIKQGKFNFSGMYSYNTQTNNNDGFTYRNNILLPPPVFGVVEKYYNQIDTNRRKSTFQFGRIAVDYYINNRNTLTLSGNYVHGAFTSNDFQHYNYDDINDVLINKGVRRNVSITSFDNYTGQLNFQHTYPKQGKEFTTTLTFNGGTSNTTYTYTTFLGYPLPNAVQTAYGGTPSWMYTYQADYVNPINEHSKIETGVRSYMQRSFSQQATYNQDSTGQMIAFSDLTNNYNITNLTNAAYINYSSKIGSFNYQAGLRFEESYYKGNITNKDLSFSYMYPDNKLNKLQYCFFPGVYLSKKLPHNQELQINFSRKINRPNFFQLMPFVFSSDNANIQIGNPKLAPEFLDMAEINYNINIWKINFLTSLYLRYTENPITNIAYPEASNPNILVNTYQNGKNKIMNGLDNTLKITPVKNLDVMLNANIFYTDVSYSSGTQLITNSGFSWTGKASVSYKFPANFTLQLNGNYHAPQIIPQGTTRKVEYLDITVSKTFKQKLTLTLLLSDVFNSKRYGTNYYTADYTQNLSNRRETRYLRFSVSYMFGKMDSSIFKKMKQMKKDKDNNSSDDQQGGMGY
ncbi:MAG: TonB-dependent receptor [Bacteroidetes bacterium]|nr:TonB-dependent receptor [Bacteroidota bacterium]